MWAVSYALSGMLAWVEIRSEILLNCLCGQRPLLFQNSALLLEISKASFILTDSLVFVVYVQQVYVFFVCLKVNVWARMYGRTPKSVCVVCEGVGKISHLMELENDRAIRVLVFVSPVLMSSAAQAPLSVSQWGEEEMLATLTFRWRKQSQQDIGTHTAGKACVSKMIIRNIHSPIPSSPTSQWQDSFMSF